MLIPSVCQRCCSHKCTPLLRIDQPEAHSRVSNLIFDRLRMSPATLSKSFSDSAINGQYALIRVYLLHSLRLLQTLLPLNYDDQKCMVYGEYRTLLPPKPSKSGEGELCNYRGASIARSCLQGRLLSPVQIVVFSLEPIASVKTTPQ